MISIGDVLIYDPSYRVDGVWQQRRGTEMVVIRAPMMDDTNIVVAPMQYAGFYADEIPWGKRWKLGLKAFRAVDRKPQWEV